MVMTPCHMCVNTSESLQAKTILFPSLIMVCFLAVSATNGLQIEKEKDESCCDGGYYCTKDWKALLDAGLHSIF